MVPITPSRQISRAQRSVTEFGSPDHVALQASGLHQGATVNDRVRHWQAHGAATAQAPDAVSVLSAPRSEGSDTPDTTQLEMAPTEDQDRSRKRKEERGSRPTYQDKAEAYRIRSASTPRKRIVSDEHWKAARSLKQDRRRDPISSGEVEDGEIEGTNAPQSRSPRKLGDVRTEREQRRQRRAKAGSRKLQEHRDVGDGGDHGRDISGPGPSSIAGEPLSNGDLLSDLKEGDFAEEFGTVRDESPLEYDASIFEGDDKPRQKSKYAETLGRPPQAYPDSQPRSRKRLLLDKTKEVLGVDSSTPVMSNRLPSIEAWLDDQPDPFVEGKSLSAQIKEDRPRPLKVRSTKRSTLEKSPPPLDPNKIWESVGTYSELQQPSGDRGSEVQRTTSAPVVEVELENTSPVSLKRRSAKASRPKRHTLPAVQHEDGHNEPDRGAKVHDGSYPRKERHVLQGEPAKLSTIASVETFHEQDIAVEESPETTKPENKAKVLTDEDMMTVLSQQTLRRGSRRKRTVRVANDQQKTDHTKQILETLAEEQAKYCRELRTLVDGVIPVLLQCVLSKSDAVAAAGLFTTSANITNDLSFSRPIIDMGVALERLKSLHNRMPIQNANHLFSWCQSAHKAYLDYLKAWRLGFQDVVINLAPLEGSDGESNEVMARNASGDIVNSDGQTVDIAYLMKRPLVNIRKIGRALSTLQEEMPDNPAAEKAADQFRDLTAAAKTKHQQEQGRIEDETAASADATKCRDIRNLGPLPGVTIAKNKRVRAKDYFDMTLFHSSGQRMDCKIELTMRDNQQPSPEGGDLLICQIDEAGKWLLFAPTDLGSVSARKGESGCDLVIMLRGRAGLGQEWRELLALRAEEPEAVSEWMLMLGSNPLPPKLSRTPSFVDIKDKQSVTTASEQISLTKVSLAKIPTSETIDIPIGEPSVLGTVPTKKAMPRSSAKNPLVEKPLPRLSLGGGLQKKPVPEHWQTQNPVIARKPAPPSVLSSDRSTISGSSASSSSTYTPSSLAPLSRTHTPTERAEVGEVKAQRRRSEFQDAEKPGKISNSRDNVSLGVSSRAGEQTPWETLDLSQEQGTKTKGKSTAHTDTASTALSGQSHHRTLSLTPTQAPPNIVKTRSNSSSNIPLTDAIHETWSTLSGFGRKAVSQSGSEESGLTDPCVRPSVLERGESSRQGNLSTKLPLPGAAVAGDVPPPPPQHKQASVLAPRPRNIPTLRPSEAQKRIEREKGILPHSPLRKQYTPSSASNSGNSSPELSSSDDDDSQTSEELQYEHQKHTKPRSDPTSRRSSQTPARYSQSAPTVGTRTIAPSDSASQGPYRRVPTSTERPEGVKRRAIAMICSWNDKGLWDPLVEDYCSIIISPGLLEAFVMSEAHSGASSPDQRPLAAFELTPMVPLRKGTGLDINIRSPPTPASQIQTSSNIMFRSRNVMECESLYQMINWARCHNPTYIELERSRPRPQPNVTFSNQQAPRPRSWFSFGGGMKRRNSYRVGNIPPSSMGESQATTNTVSSAMSALKRLTQSSAFNVDRSSVARKPGTGTDGSLYSSSNGTGVDSSGNTPPPSQLGFVPGADGPNAPPTSAAAVDGAGMVHNMRIRLQVRRSQGWVTMGFSRLTILPAVKRSDVSPEISRPASSSSDAGGAAEPPRRASTMTSLTDPAQRQYRLASSHYTPIRAHGGGREKRVVVTWEKDPNQILLDATLGESCFEKISHLGIAVQVWQPEEEVRSHGGVCIGRNTKFLFQFFSAKECAWVFDLVGRYRYGDALNE